MPEQIKFVLGEGRGETYTPRPSRAANCPGCGRFCKSSPSTGYDGICNQIWVTTYCAQCGENTESLI